MRRAAIVGVFVVAFLASAGSAWAQDTLTITPPTNPNPGDITLQLTGSTSIASAFVAVYAIAAGQTCDATYSQASTGYAGDPFTSADVSTPGPFDETTAYMDLPNTGTYLLCGYLLEYPQTQTATATASVTVVAVPVAPVTPPAPTVPLACSESPDLAVTVSPSVLGGRTGSFSVEPANGASGLEDSNETFAVEAANPSQPIRFPSSGPVSDSGLGTFRTALGDGPIVVTIDWNQATDDGSTCARTATSSQVTVLTKGLSAGVGLATNSDSSAAILAFKGDCALITPSSVEVTVQGPPGVVRRFHAPDVCGSWTGSGGPTLPNLSFDARTGTIAAPISLRIAPTGGGQSSSFIYALTVKYAGVTRESNLEASVVYQPPTFVYEGTDAFVNYCIDDDRRLMSLHLRLYCIRPGYTHQTLKFSTLRRM